LKKKPVRETSETAVRQTGSGGNREMKEIFEWWVPGLRYLYSPKIAKLLFHPSG